MKHYTVKWNGETIKLRKILNPRGNLAKEIEIGLRRSVWLVRLCELWLSYNDNDHRVAASSKPFVPPPNLWDDDLTRALKEAIKGCELWQRPGQSRSSGFKMLKSGPKVYERPPMDPAYSRRAPWSFYYRHWREGSLERGINDLLRLLPKENRKRIRELMDE
jgi:hypothetical protein